MSLSTPEKKQRRYYSGKKKQHTQKAQVIVDKLSGKILATAFCEGKMHDFVLFKKSKTCLLAAQVCLADSGYQGLESGYQGLESGYQGLEKCCSNSRTPKKKSKKHPLTDFDKAQNRAISHQRIGCEHAIGRLKVFQILTQPYRNRRKRFGLRFNLLAAICNLEREH